MVAVMANMYTRKGIKSISNDAILAVSHEKYESCKNGRGARTDSGKQPTLCIN
jgi:hypothetical protein